MDFSISEGDDVRYCVIVKVSVVEVWKTFGKQRTRRFATSRKAAAPT